MKNHNLLSFGLSLLFLLPNVLFTNNLLAQNSKDLDLIKHHINAKANGLELLQSDVETYEITHFHTSKQSGITHYYIRQQHEGIPIHNAVIGLHLDANGEIVQMHNQFVSNIAKKVNTKKAGLDAQATLARVAQKMQYDQSQLPVFIEKTGNTAAQKQLFSKGSISQYDIPVQLMYMPTQDGSLRLCWDMSIAEIQDADWWSMRVDAQTGQILDKINWTVYCNFDHERGCEEDGHVYRNSFQKKKNSLNHSITQSPNYTQSTLNAPDSYRVYPEPVESPSHGGRQLVINPADLNASPFGWHDTNGSPGAEYTITRGNNVWAQDDIGGNNGTGFSPDGSASLDFDFGLDLTQNPNTSPNLESGIVNLFYWNNLTHDVWYQYGFDEASGNFQSNNYGNGGSGGDYVLADAQDGGSTNNANFSVPTDGGNGRMQMYLWTGASAGTLNVNSPGSIAGPYSTESAQFGATTYNINGNLVIVNDGSATPNEGCGALVNGGAINGNIALVDRGTCEFGLKCLNAQNAGAVAVIVCNNVGGSPIAMSPGADGASVTIPAVMISQSECEIIRAQIPTVNVTLTSGSSVNRDGDLDNGIIAHEYGHGISIRLTGGGGNSGCLSNTEQMGEGWSDWFGLMMTIDPSDTRNDIRPIGTFALGQSTGGSGIRTYPYTCDLNINLHSYNDIGSEAIPHGIGSVWCAMLWEMTWDLIDLYGYDPNIHTGTGGNNVAMALVIEGLKLQPCSPGFVDGRNAIIAADQALYNGANECLIRTAFARRGLGDNASQGSTNSATDGSEDFNTVACAAPTCTDGVQNGNETGLDCGGPDCEACPPEDCTTYDFTGAVVSYDANSNDFGTATVQDAGATVYMTGNAWKAVPINYTVTPNTVIEFDFKSTVQGEIHEIAFDNDLVFGTTGPDHRIVVYGTQGYNGTFTNATYNGSGNFEHFVVPLGTDFTGTFANLVLTCDDDANAAGDSFFSNVQIYEDYDGSLSCNPSCPSILSITSPVAAGLYAAGVEVNCNTNVNAGTTVGFQAGSVIILENGFSTPANTNFGATIRDCQ